MEVSITYKLSLNKQTVNQVLGCICKEIVYFDKRGQNERLAHCKCKNVALTLDLDL